MSDDTLLLLGGGALLLYLFSKKQTAAATTYVPATAQTSAIPINQVTSSAGLLLPLIQKIAPTLLPQSLTRTAPITNVDPTNQSINTLDSGNSLPSTLPVSTTDTSSLTSVLPGASDTSNYFASSPYVDPDVDLFSDDYS